MELDILRIDYDLDETKTKTILLKRLSYLYDLQFFSSIDIFKKIELIKKRNCCVRIFLNKKLKNEYEIIMLQLLLGSDWQKEANTIINHFILEMKYSNRIFTTKRYYKKETQEQNIINAQILDITTYVKLYLNSKNRKLWSN